MYTAFPILFSPLLFMLAAMAVLYLRRRPLRLSLLFYAAAPVWPAMPLQYLFPGVHLPPDPAHANPSSTYVDNRPGPEPPTGLRRKLEAGKLS